MCICTYIYFYLGMWKTNTSFLASTVFVQNEPNKPILSLSADTYFLTCDSHSRSDYLPAFTSCSTSQLQRTYFITISSLINFRNYSLSIIKTENLVTYWKPQLLPVFCSHVNFPLITHVTLNNISKLLLHQLPKDSSLPVCKMRLLYSCLFPPAFSSLPSKLLSYAVRSDNTSLWLP